MAPGVGGGEINPWPRDNESYNINCVGPFTRRDNDSDKTVSRKYEHSH